MLWSRSKKRKREESKRGEEKKKKKKKLPYLLGGGELLGRGLVVRGRDDSRGERGAASGLGEGGGAGCVWKEVERGFGWGWGSGVEESVSERESSWKKRKKLYSHGDLSSALKALVLMIERKNLS